MHRRGLYAHVRRNRTAPYILLLFFILLAMAQMAASFLLFVDTAVIGWPTGGQASFTSLNAPVADSKPPSTMHSLREVVDYVMNAPQLVRTSASIIMIYILFSALYSFMGHWRGTRGAPGKLVARNKMPGLYNMVEDMAIQVGLPTPDIRLVNSKAMNAFAHGLSEKKSTIILTMGLLQRLTPQELQAVLAHEITHIRNGDTRFMTMAQVCFDVGGMTAVLRYYSHPVNVIRALIGIGMLLSSLGVFVSRDTVLLIGINFFLIALPLMLRPLIIQSNEFAADAGAIEITKNPLALANALRKIEGMSALPVSGKIISAMMISGPSKGSNATHPPLEERIQAIVRHGGVMVEEYMRAASDIPPPPGIPVAGAPVFGRSGITSGAAPAFGQAPAFRFGHAAAPEAGNQDEKELEAWLDDMGKDRDLTKALRDMEPYIVGTMIALALIIPILNALFPSLGIFGKFIH